MRDTVGVLQPGPNGLLIVTDRDQIRCGDEGMPSENTDEIQTVVGDHDKVLVEGVTYHMGPRVKQRLRIHLGKEVRLFPE